MTDADPSVDLSRLNNPSSNARRIAITPVPLNWRKGSRVRRRDFIAALGSAPACQVVARAQPRDQIKRVAFVSSFRVVEPIFRQELARLGWVEGRNVRIETLLEDYRAVRAAAPFLVSTTPDPLVVVGTENAQTFNELTDTIPIIFAFVADPVAINLVENLAHPGGNLTGFSHLPHSSLAGKMAQLA